MRQVHFADEAELTLFAEDFARALIAGDCITLEGELGTGKTTFARAVIRSLAGDFDESLEVPSPTYTLVQQYDGVLPIAHMDLYRITDSEELDELGLEAALENGSALIEWPSKAQHRLPDNAVSVQLEEIVGSPDGRLMKITAHGDFDKRLARSLAIREFLSENAMASAKRYAFSGDASARAYESIQYENDKPLILMDAPRLPDGPPIYEGLPYSQVVHLAEDVSAFVAVSELLISKGFCAPRILGQDLDQGFLIIENLGSDKIVTAGNKPIRERYLDSVEVLASIHNQRWPDRWPLQNGKVHLVPRYDVRAMRTGLSLLPDWWGRENNLSDSMKEHLYALWEPIFERFQSGYDDLILRDFHSPNIVWREAENGHDRVGIIDHQDALIGPGTYDVASLMQDARTVVPIELQKEILDTYCTQRLAHGMFDEEQARHDVATLAAFRNSRLLGLWVRLDVRDGKSRFRQYEGQTRLYLKQALAHPALTGLRDWYLEAGIIDGS